MSVRLAKPNGDNRDPNADPALVGDWYQELSEAGAPVDRFLPLFQGDVLVGVPLDDVPLTDIPQDPLPEGAEELTDAVMLVGHPCSMVAGSVLLPYQEVVRVRRSQAVRYERYDDGRYEEFFLPYLDPADPGVHYSACLHERTLVPTERLDPERRVAALGLNGVIALQQRITHETSRVKMSASMLHAATWPRFFEVQLAREWNDRVLTKLALEGDDLRAALRTEAAAFDAAVSADIKATDPESGYVLATTLRSQMFDPANEGRVSTAVKLLIRKRKAEVATQVQREKQLAQQAAKRAEQERAAQEATEPGAPPEVATPPAEVPPDQPT